MMQRREYPLRSVTFRRYQCSDISGRVKTTETKVEMKMHLVIYMKPGSGFILDNRTNYSVKGP
jgi:hypothetical protein